MKHFDSHRLLLGFFAALFLAAVVMGALLTEGGSSKPLTSVIHEKLAGYEYEIVYTGSGFKPRDLEVPLGARVAFRNAATNTDLWVASDPYPDRTDYSALDSKSAFPSGKSFIFRFDRGGTFGFHNQNVPVDSATIRVTNPQHPTPTISKTRARQQAIRDTLALSLLAGQPNSIFGVVDAIDHDPILSLDCHDVAHDLGHRSYELYGFSGAMTYNNPKHAQHASVMDICAGGYVHGVLEEASIHDVTFADNPDTFCKNVPSSNSASCYHGVGHALMFFTERSIPASLASCRKLDNANNASRCFEGVWMELFWGNTEHSGPDSLGWSLDAPLAPCIATGKDAKPACFIYASFGYLRAHVKDYTGAVHLCTTSGLSSSDASFCLKGVGIAMVGHFKAKHLEQSESYVAGLTADQKLGFYKGILGYARLSGVAESSLYAACAAMILDSAVCNVAIEASR